MLLNTRFDVGPTSISTRTTRYRNATPSRLSAPCSTSARITFTSRSEQRFDGHTLDEGPCAADRKHLFNLTSVLRTPRLGGVLGAIASGWTAASVLQCAAAHRSTSSQAATRRSADSRTTRQPSARTWCRAPTPYGDATPDRLLQPRAFSQPAPGTLATRRSTCSAGLASGNGTSPFVRAFHPDAGQPDRAASRGDQLTNHFNKGNPSATLNNPATSDESPRWLSARRPDLAVRP